MFIPHADAHLFTVDFGNSPRTLVALGGWAGSWEVWTETFSLLSKSWRTVAYDHRGSGATVAPSESIRIEALVSDLFAVLDTLAIRQCVLAAESAGVATALLAALQHPERFQGLVLVDGLYHRPSPERPDPFVQGLKANFPATIAGFVEACVPEPDSDPIRRWGRQILSRSEPAAAIRLYECLYGLDLRPQVSLLNLPTLIIHGDTDRLVPLQEAEWLAANIPHAQLHVLKGAGHVPTVTRPQEVAETVNRFFANL